MQQHSPQSDEPDSGYYGFAKASMEEGLRQELQSRRLGSILIKEGVINSEQLEWALQEQKKSGESLGTILITKGYATEEQIPSYTVIQTGMPYISLECYEIDPKIARLLDNEVAAKNLAIVIDKIDNTLLVAMANPANQKNRNDLSGCLQDYQLSFLLSSAEEIRQKLQEIYS